MYALGRGLDHRDETTIDLLMETLEKAGGRPSALLTGLIESDAFQRRRATDPTPATDTK